MCIVAITQMLVKLQEEKVLKEQVDTSQHKEEELKAWLKPWLDEAYVLTTTIEGKLPNLQVTQQKIQADNVALATKQLVDQVK